MAGAYIIVFLGLETASLSISKVLVKGLMVQWQRSLAGVLSRPGFKPWVPHLYATRVSLGVFQSKNFQGS
jgi:hypothetical protein